jgi:hypothetical protein
LGCIFSIEGHVGCTSMKENPDQLCSLNHRFLISSLGLFIARLWARHIHDRFRDAVSAQAPSPCLQALRP